MPPADGRLRGVAVQGDPANNGVAIVHGNLDLGINGPFGIA